MGIGKTFVREIFGGPSQSRDVMEQESRRRIGDQRVGGAVDPGPIAEIERLLGSEADGVDGANRRPGIDCQETIAAIAGRRPPPTAGSNPWVESGHSSTAKRTRGPASDPAYRPVV